jgi:predicted glycogen debranching enzyme
MSTMTTIEPSHTGSQTDEAIVFNWSPQGDPEFLRQREWLVTNGLGGYASGTLLGLATRRYHGLFVPNLPSPRGRTVMVPRLDDEVVFDGRSVHLSGAEFMDGRREGELPRHLSEFRVEWQIPSWTFDVAGRRITKRIVMPFGQNTTYVEYTLVSGPPCRLRVRPFFTFRMHDGPLGTPGDWSFSLLIKRGGRYEMHAFDGAPPLRFCMRPRAGAFVVDERTAEGVFYEVEKSRGYDHREDLQTPGYFAHDLEIGKPVSAVFSTEPWELLDLDGATVMHAERARLQKLLSLAPPVAQSGPLAQLVIAADQFVILPGSRLEENAIARASGDEVRTVVAGYHWFTDWGRDTMISLEGLTLCTGRHREARAILRTFSHYVKDGLLPNLFPEGARTALYHTVDATLWFFHAIDRYLVATGDRETLESLFPALESIIEHHLKGTHFGIGMDPADGLIRAAAPGYQLTWMDAKVGDWVVTPRRGKPVEIQALWYNALRCMATWARELGRDTDPERYASLAGQAHRSFNERFWYEEGGHLYDVVDGEQGDDASLRPNQLFSFSLRHPILLDTRWRPVLDIVTERLLTPYGIRTLDPAHKDYKPRYEGDLWARDAAYHQGLVWGWLIGPFMDAWRRVYPEPVAARRLLDGLIDHLQDAGVGSVSEVFDADPPYTPRGCIAQAWSVAELLRSLITLETEMRANAPAEATSASDR